MKLEEEQSRMYELAFQTNSYFERKLRSHSYDLLFMSRTCTLIYDVKTFLGKTALHWTASVDNEKATALLLKNNAKKDAQDSKVICTI